MTHGEGIDDDDSPEAGSRRVARGLRRNRTTQRNAGESTGPPHLRVSKVYPDMAVLAAAGTRVPCGIVRCYLPAAAEVTFLPLPIIYRTVP